MTKGAQFCIKEHSPIDNVDFMQETSVVDKIKNVSSNKFLSLQKKQMVGKGNKSILLEVVASISALEHDLRPSKDSWGPHSTNFSQQKDKDEKKIRKFNKKLK